ncbi:putative AB hydrolase-1 domain-containing protein [Seiridium cardinale]
MAVHSLSYPAPAGNDTASSRDVLIFFISGNPGLIDYYTPFFESLRSLIDATPGLNSTRFHIYGQDLAGFNDEDHKPFDSQEPPRDVEYQVKNSLDVISSLRIESGSKKDKPFDDVILAGHSVGTYIGLQIFHRLLKDPSLAPHLHLKAGILLFPTIEHISHSRQGRQLDLLRRTPVLGPNAHTIAQGFLRLWPYSALYGFVNKILGFPPHAATVTTKFLKSRDGVWQALYMGMDEMKVIGEDTWDEELWEIERETEQQSEQLTPKFFFFFGKEDHWVASHLRDAFIERRQKQTERTRFVVDEGNLPHAFCIRDSETVAEKVLVWIKEIYGDQ